MPAASAASPLLIICLTAGIVGSGVAQSPATLGSRTARSKYALGRIFAAQELADGRVVASDGKEQVFRLVDFAKGEVGLLGKPGDDSTSYRTASVIVTLPGDALGLYDPAGRKVMRVTPQGTIESFTPLPVVASGRRLGTLLGADQNGLLYFTLPEQFDTGTTANSGMARITRVNIAAGTDEPILSFRTRRADQLKIDGVMPYFYRDAVAVRPDGLIARVVADTYQVIWSRDGRETGRTGPMAYTPINITQAEQTAIKDSIAESVKAMFGGGNGPGNVRTTTSGLPDGVSVTSSGTGSGARTMTSFGTGSSGGAPIVITNPGGGGGVTQQYTPKNADGTTSTTPMDMKSMMDRIANQPLGKFPDTKPPIATSGVVARFDAHGNLWVLRERVHGDVVPHYDVIAEGKGVVARVDLPANTRLVGFGKNAVYIARAENGTDWLERYGMPAVP